MHACRAGLGCSQSALDFMAAGSLAGWFAACFALHLKMHSQLFILGILVVLALAVADWFFRVTGSPDCVLP